MCLIRLAGVRIQGRIGVAGDVIEEALAGAVGGSGGDGGGLAEEEDEGEEEGGGEEERPEIGEEGEESGSEEDEGGEGEGEDEAGEQMVFEFEQLFWDLHGGMMTMMMMAMDGRSPERERERGRWCAEIL